MVTLEEEVKQWMCHRLVFDKGKLKHWFEVEKPDTGVIAAYAVEEFRIQPYAFTLVEQWAREVLASHE